VRGNGGEKEGKRRGRGGLAWENWETTSDEVCNIHFT